MIRVSSLVVSISCFAYHASAQPKDTPEVPKKPEQRTWHPTTDEYFPEKIVGSWIRYNDKTLVIIAREKYPDGVVPKSILLNSIPVYTLSATKGDEAKGGIPSFASVELKDKEAQSFSIVDVATASVGQGASELFCRDWHFLKEARDWKAGDELRYINAALLSHVSWKIGTEHSKGADVGIEGIFNAGGKQYDQSTASAMLPGMSFVTTVKEMRQDDISGKSCQSATKPRHGHQNLVEILDLNPAIFNDLTLASGVKQR